MLHGNISLNISEITIKPVLLKKFYMKKFYMKKLMLYEICLFQFSTIPLLLFAILFEISGHHACSGLLVHSHLNQALYGQSFLNISGETMKNCLERYLANCLCLSFQVCVNATSLSCQLCSSNKYLKPQAMSERKGCTNFHFGNLDVVK